MLDALHECVNRIRQRSNESGKTTILHPDDPVLNLGTTMKNNDGPPSEQNKQSPFQRNLNIADPQLTEEGVHQLVGTLTFPSIPMDPSEFILKRNNSQTLQEIAIKEVITRVDPAEQMRGYEPGNDGTSPKPKRSWFKLRKKDPTLEKMPNLIRSRTDPAIDYKELVSAPADSTTSPRDGETITSYTVYPPFATVRIHRDTDACLHYTVIEPVLEPREAILLEETHEYFRDTLLYNRPLGPEEMALTLADLQRVVRMFDPSFPEHRMPVLYYFLTRNFYGYGRIDPLMRDPALEDISCNGPGIPVYVYHRIYGSIPTNITFQSEEMNRFVLRLAQKADKQISFSTPLVDAHLPNGSRIQLTFSDVVSTRGSSFTIRKFKSDPMTPLNLIEYGTFDAEMLAFIWYAIENRSSAIIAGGTASGKTSTMNAISFFIPHNAKIVSLEDTREIQLPHQNWLPTQTREVSLASVRGEIDMFSLLKSSLRQRPEYMIVGEVRGKEAQTLFQAMNAGHTTLSTLHAGDIDEAINRLTNEPIAVPPVMFSALDLMVIQAIHHRSGKIMRRCDAIHEIAVDQDGTIHHNPLFIWNPKTDGFVRMVASSHVLQRIAYDHGVSEDAVTREIECRRAFLLDLLHEPPGTTDDLLKRIHDFHTRGALPVIPPLNSDPRTNRT